MPSWGKGTRYIQSQSATEVVAAYVHWKARVGIQGPDPVAPVWELSANWERYQDVESKLPSAPIKLFWNRDFTVVVPVSHVAAIIRIHAGSNDFAFAADKPIPNALPVSLVSSTQTGDVLVNVYRLTGAMRVPV
jgi:hypothetical protein